MGRRLWILLFIAGLLQVACEAKRPPSVLIVAVDSLPFHASLCTGDGEEEHSGFRTLCNESIRFTHAMTTSPLSVPALTSIMTGLYPFQHEVRANGGPGLSPHFRTFAESALGRGYRTSFFSGGAPLWRRTGLHQGFEIFDDNLNISAGRLFRPFSESRRLFENWLFQEVEDRAFVSVIYVPDLNFTDTVTETNNGEIRSLSYDSQLEELDETLGELFGVLKKSNRWNDTFISVVGLNGREISPRSGEIEPLLLNSENTQVSLFMKATNKPRDEAMKWTIDRNVTLADLGRTFFEITGGSFPATTHDSFPVHSLKAGLLGKRPDWPVNRPLLIESAWSQWQGVGGVRAAVLRDYTLLLNDQTPLAYNTLTDRLETSPSPPSAADQDLLAAMKSAGYRPWEKPDASFRAIFQIPALNWLSPARAPAWHRQLVSLSEKSDADPRVLRWAAQSSLEQKDWQNLARIGKQMRSPLWTAVAERNLGKKAALNDSCLNLIGRKSPTNEQTKACNDELFLSLYAWVRADQENDPGKEAARRRFLKSWEISQQDLRILKGNAGLGLIWLPSAAESVLPNRTSLALALPEMRKFSP
ncbi:MAG: sulfatase-like hydrolase/transferase [Bdellovibrionaceae bacterium]|nr:sulfatase-like hydrolase/transferase [Pseudobdellovibrionaceae bacterium]MBX3032737.1 sulfatase-like hydrolase/transferase [Pseudobdellovibrionaceae bacterium]